MVLDGRKVGAETGIGLHDASESHLEERNERGAEVPSESSVMPQGNRWIGNLHDALAGHGVGLLIHSLDIPEALVLVLIVGSHHNRNNVDVKPQTGAQRGAHVLERGGETSTDEFGEVFVLVALDLLNDIVGNKVVAHAHSIVELDVLHREVEQIRGVVDRKRDDGSVVVGEDSRNTKVQSLKSPSERMSMVTEAVAVISLSNSAEKEVKSERHPPGLAFAAKGRASRGRRKGNRTS